MQSAKMKYSSVLLYKIRLLSTCIILDQFHVMFSSRTCFKARPGIERDKEESREQTGGSDRIGEGVRLQRESDLYLLQELHLIRVPVYLITRPVKTMYYVNKLSLGLSIPDKYMSHLIYIDYVFAFKILEYQN